MGKIIIVKEPHGDFSEFKRKIVIASLDYPYSYGWIIFRHGAPQIGQVGMAGADVEVILDAFRIASQGIMGNQYYMIFTASDSDELDIITSNEAALDEQFYVNHDKINYENILLNGVNRSPYLELYGCDITLFNGYFRLLEGSQSYVSGSDIMENLSRNKEDYKKFQMFPHTWMEHNLSFRQKNDGVGLATSMAFIHDGKMYYSGEWDEISKGIKMTPGYVGYPSYQELKSLEEMSEAIPLSDIQLEMISVKEMFTMKAVESTSKVNLLSTDIFEKREKQSQTLDGLMLLRIGSNETDEEYELLKVVGEEGDCFWAQKSLSFDSDHLTKTRTEAFCFHYPKSSQVEKVMKINVFSKDEIRKNVPSTLQLPTYYLLIRSI